MQQEAPLKAGAIKKIILGPPPSERGARGDEDSDDEDIQLSPEERFFKKENQDVMIPFLNEYGPCVVPVSRMVEGAVKRDVAVTSVLTDSDLSFLVLTYLDRYRLWKEQLDKNDDRASEVHSRVDGVYCQRLGRKMRGTGYNKEGMELYKKGMEFFKTVRQSEKWDTFEEACADDFKERSFYLKRVGTVNRRPAYSSYLRAEEVVSEEDMPALPPLPPEPSWTTDETAPQQDYEEVADSALGEQEQQHQEV